MLSRLEKTVENQVGGDLEEGDVSGGGSPALQAQLQHPLSQHQHLDRLLTGGGRLHLAGLDLLPGSLVRFLLLPLRGGSSGMLHIHLPLRQLRPRDLSRAAILHQPGSLARRPGVGLSNTRQSVGVRAREGLTHLVRADGLDSHFKS